MFAAVPLQDNYNTTFEISYKTTGTKNEASPIFAKLETHKTSIALLVNEPAESSSTMMIVIIAVVAVIMSIIVGVCVKRRLSNQHD